MKLLVYSHDTFGLGNIRRMLAICEYLLETLPNLSILLVSGSAQLTCFRLPQGLDTLKLPCMRRDLAGELSPKSLGTSAEDLVRIRTDLIRSVVMNFQPDVLLVDKKPSGISGELIPALQALHQELPASRCVLLLRDILASPEITMAEWQQQGASEAIRRWYDQIWVVGSPEVFDLRSEYQLPSDIAEKVKFCGYIRKPASSKPVAQVRQMLGIQEQPMVLVTPGGGEDGYALIESYLQGLAMLPADLGLHSVVVMGPELPLSQQQHLIQLAQPHPRVQMLEFSADLISLMQSAQCVVSMAGYNTTCEILSLAKPAVVVPRIKPVQEQWMRAERLSQLGLLQAIHPQDLTPNTLIQAVLTRLTQPSPVVHLDMRGLPRIAELLAGLLPPTNPVFPTYAWADRPALRLDRLQPLTA
jgi:predicted glycosyltransferase